MNEKKYTDIVEHYESCFDKHGDSHLGMDWPKADDAEKRYQVMLDIARFSKSNSKNFSLLDFGCGTAHLYEYILKNKLKGIEYRGLDLSEKFVHVCRQKFPDIKFYCADLLESPNAVANADYIVMNGVFTEKRQLSFEEMFEYFEKLVTATFAKADTGIAFNVMSKAVDWEREDLFHVPTDLLIQFMTKKLSRNFIIRNDYGLYEYTVYLYK